MEITNLAQFTEQIPDEAAAWKMVERLCWPDGKPVCPHCAVKDENHYKLKPRCNSRGKPSARRVWKCRACRRQFTALVGTVFHGTKVPLRKWLMAIWMMCSAKNGVSAHEIHRSLGVTYKTAWFMCHRVRKAMERQPLASKLNGTVEADETYFGGKQKGHRGHPGPGSNKAAVVSLVERDGEVRSHAVANVRNENLHRILLEQIDRGAKLMIDQYRGYVIPGRQFVSHETVNHARNEYVRGNVHTNTVEGYFSKLKRSLTGTYSTSAASTSPLPGRVRLPA